jgi:hypothetical protein
MTIAQRFNAAAMTSTHYRNAGGVREFSPPEAGANHRTWIETTLSPGGATDWDKSLPSPNGTCDFLMIETQRQNAGLLSGGTRFETFPLVNSIIRTFEFV